MQIGWFSGAALHQYVFPDATSSHKKMNSVPDGQGLPAEAGPASPLERSLLLHRLPWSSANMRSIVTTAGFVAVDS